MVSDTGGLLIFHTQDEAEVWELVDRDPYSAADVLSRVRIHEWNPVLGYLTDHLPHT
ncbi:YciI family protein [Catenulispora subtropica]|uniref:YCII-related domain-containing protein n=1 Tax=Catenulispora subtropica TaxID=450798 RepID=A0ABN2RM25_9ACTN